MLWLLHSLAQTSSACRQLPWSFLAVSWWESATWTRAQLELLPRIPSFEPNSRASRNMWLTTCSWWLKKSDTSSQNWDYGSWRRPLVGLTCSMPIPIRWTRKQQCWNSDRFLKMSIICSQTSQQLEEQSSRSVVVIGLDIIPYLFRQLKSENWRRSF